MEEKNNMEQTNSVKRDPGLVFVWGQFKTWDKTANRLKKMIKRWRVILFIMVIVGSFTAVMSQTMMSWEYEMLSKIFSITSALAIGFYTYAAREVLSDDLEKGQVRARATAESFKSEVYLYQQKAPPYHEQDPSQVLFERTEELIQSATDVSSEALSEEEQLEGLPSVEISFKQYIEERIKESIYGFYLPKAKAYQKSVQRGKAWGYALGFAGVVLGVLGTTGLSQYTSVWISFITTASASVTSFVSSQRYQYLVISYQTAAYRLMMQLVKGSKIVTSDIEAQKLFVVECEEVISVENKAWLTELLKKKEKEVTIEIDQKKENI